MAMERGPWGGGPWGGQGGRIVSPGFFMRSGAVRVNVPWVGEAAPGF